MKRTIQNLNPKTIALAVVVALLVIFAFSQIGFPKSGEGFNKNYENKTFEITWEYVNVRDSACGNIIGTLYKGDTVTLTGKTYSYFNGPRGLTDWVELVDGTWITRSAIN